METTRKLIEAEVNPYVNEWEESKSFPAHKVFKAFGQAGLLGINKPTEFGGLGLPYKYQLAFGEALGHIRAGGVSKFPLLSWCGSLPTTVQKLDVPGPDEKFCLCWLCAFTKFSS